MGWGIGEERKGDGKGSRLNKGKKLSYVHVATPQDDRKLHVLQTCSNTIKKLGIATQIPIAMPLWTFGMGCYICLSFFFFTGGEKKKEYWHTNSLIG